MIDIEKIKNLPNTQDKPMTQNKKAKFLKMLAERDKDAIYESFERRIGPERYAASQAIVREIVDNMDRDFLRNLDILPHEPVNPEISVAPTDFPILNQKGLKIVNSILENIMEE